MSATALGLFIAVLCVAFAIVMAAVSDRMPLCPCGKRVRWLYGSLHNTTNAMLVEAAIAVALLVAFGIVLAAMTGTGYRLSAFVVGLAAYKVVRAIVHEVKMKPPRLPKRSAGRVRINGHGRLATES